MHSEFQLTFFLNSIFLSYSINFLLFDFGFFWTSAEIETRFILFKKVDVAEADQLENFESKLEGKNFPFLFSHDLKLPYLISGMISFQSTDVYQFRVILLSYGNFPHVIYRAHSLL